MLRKLMKELESYMDKKYPEFRCKFYINRRNTYIHIGMDKNLYQFSNFKTYISECEKFINERLNKELFIFYRIPHLVTCTKWKFDYIIGRKVDKLFEDGETNDIHFHRFCL